MSIKDITGISSATPVDPSKGGAVAPQKRGAQQPAPAATVADQVTLTSVGQYLAGAADESAPVDQARVDRIRSELADGTYQVDVKSIAAKLLRLDHDLS